MSFFDDQEDSSFPLKRFKSADEVEKGEKTANKLDPPRQFALTTLQLLRSSPLSVTPRVLKTNTVASMFQAPEHSITKELESGTSESMGSDDQSDVTDEQKHEAPVQNINLETNIFMKARGPAISSSGLFALSSSSLIVRNKTSPMPNPPIMKKPSQPTRIYLSHQLNQHHDIQTDDEIAGELSKASNILQDLKADASRVAALAQSQIEKFATGMASLYRADAIFFCVAREQNLEKRLKALALGLRV